jgi:hypothetical protein
MNPHEAHCVRGRWLLEQPRPGLLGLLAVVLFQEGPTCTCRLFSPEQTPARGGSGG